MLTCYLVKSGWRFLVQSSIEHIGVNCGNFFPHSSCHLLLKHGCYYNMLLLVRKVPPRSVFPGGLVVIHYKKSEMISLKYFAWWGSGIVYYDAKGHLLKTLFIMYFNLPSILTDVHNWKKNYLVVQCVCIIVIHIWYFLRQIIKWQMNRTTEDYTTMLQLFIWCFHKCCEKLTVIFCHKKQIHEQWYFSHFLLTKYFNEGWTQTTENMLTSNIAITHPRRITLSITARDVGPCHTVHAVAWVLQLGCYPIQ